MDALFDRLLVHMQKMSIHLQNINIQFKKHVQRRIPAAKIVHQHHESVFPELLHHFLDFFRIIRTGGFGYFDFQCFMGKMILFHKRLNKLRYIKRKNIHCRYIYRNRDQGQSACFTAFQPTADLFPDKLVQIRNKAVSFQYRDKHGRRNHSAVRFYPPGQRFRTDNSGCCRPALGLEVKRNLVTF